MISNANQGGSVKSSPQPDKAPASAEPDQRGKVSDKQDAPKVRVFGGVVRERIVEVGGKIEVVEL